VLFFMLGSPFRAKVVDPEKVQLIGNIDSATNTMKLILNQVNSIELDTRNAGPGNTLNCTTSTNSTLSLRYLQVNLCSVTILTSRCIGCSIDDTFITVFS
jgi:hypothetical protein